MTLRATAGLRLLGDEVQNAILNSVRSFLRSTPFTPPSDDDVAILSGADEAVTAWVSANYLLDNFGPTKPSVGILDLGGASTQVATLSAATVPAEALRAVEVGGRPFDLYAYSHLGYGLHEARRHADRIAATEGGASLHPCFAKDADVATDVRMKDGTLERVVFKGEGSAARCAALASKLLKEGGSEISFAAVPAPKSEGDFLAFSYYFDVLEPLRVESPFSPATVAAHRDAICGESAADIAARGISPDFASRACFDLSYIYAILKEGVGSDDGAKRFHLVRKINGKEMSWSLGLMLLNFRGGGGAKPPTTHMGGGVSLSHGYGAVVVAAVVVAALYARHAMRRYSSGMVVKAR